MASEGRAGLLPIPRCARQHESITRFPASRMPTVAEHPGSSQSTRAGAMGSSHRIAGPVDSPAPSSASLSRQTLRRSPSSSVRAVCVNAHVRICAAGDQRWSSLPRQLLFRAFHKLSRLISSPGFMSSRMLGCFGLNGDGVRSLPSSMPRTQGAQDLMGEPQLCPNGVSRGPVDCF